MTTIEYHHEDRQIAVDSRITSGNEILTDECNKIIENDIGIWLCAGSDCEVDDFIKLKHNDKVEREPDCSALLVKDNSCFAVQFSDGYCCYTKLTYNYTLGSGADYAAASMDHGCSAKKAVKYAMTRDSNSGGKVRVYNLK